ncbi:MAG TPA: rhodanese-like domain-containing protein [Chthoniobacterales bacterium]|nr:rhodanese-like domain-containing protein [Chthoniobacterales bacterium]
MNRRAIQIGALIILATNGSAFADGFDAMKFLMRLRFWNVPHVSTKEAARWLATDSAPILLDVRTQAEYAVSHLPNAQRIDPDAQVAETLSRLPPDRPIVTYCAVGYRSGKLAQRLIAAGRKNVYNLEGSIFQWANEGRPLECDGKRVETVHPYNDTVGKLLDRRYRANVPPIME